MLEEEYKYYKDNQEMFLKEYEGKVLVIKGKSIVGIYDDEAVAYKDSISKYKLGTFLIQKCVPEEETIQTFHSNIIFS